MTTSWRDLAACADRDPAMWDVDFPDTWRAGQAICERECPVRAACLLDAMQTEVGSHVLRATVRGGLTPRQRERLARRGKPGEANDDILARPQPTPTACRTCQRPLRAERIREAEAVGTLKHAGRGLCTACHRLDMGHVREPRPHARKAAS